MKYICSQGHIAQVDPQVVRMRSRLGMKPKCAECFHTMGLDRDMQVLVVNVSRSDNHKRSSTQERRVAAREGGRNQPASGSRPGYEGDVRTVGKFRGECKLTRGAGYRLNLKDLLAVERQAAGGELPVMDIEFQCQNPPKRYVVLPEWVYETLMTESGRRNNEAEEAR